jgi:hypothetical protein
LGPGFKYHIVSISAIFFALTVGLVVGSVFVSPQLASRQARAIDHLQETLNSDVQEKRQELDRYRECMDVISPLALRGRLGVATVAVIQTGDYPDAAGQASDAIALADPRAIVHLTLTPALDRPDDDIRASLAAPRSANPAFPADREGVCETLAATLAHGDPARAPLLPQLEREGLLRLTPDDSYGLPVKLAVVVAGSKTTESVRAARLDVPLVRALLRQGITVVACESRDALASDIPSFRVFRDEISTVDNVDTDIGRCALVLAFSAPHADYGVKPGAVHLLPPPPDAP